MTEKEILELGFKKNFDCYSYYVGFGSFIHIILKKTDKKDIALIFIGDKNNVFKCYHLYRTIKNIEDLKELIRIFG